MDTTWHLRFTPLLSGHWRACLRWSGENWADTENGLAIFVLGREVVRGVGRAGGGGGDRGVYLFDFLFVLLKGWFSQSVLSFP